MSEINRRPTMAHDHLTLGWKVVRPDLRTRGGFRWPWPGQWAEADPGDREFSVGDACPRFDGDGLCIARTWRGAASGGIPAATVLLLAYDQADVLGSDANKLRVRRAFVVDVWDVQQMIRDGQFREANLRGANLYGADLYGANLYGANLRGANLYGANLRGANLYGANLYGANLGGADLYGANLREADLGGADLYGANLREANLYGANLRGANLRWTLSDKWTCWPVGFDPAPHNESVVE